jgi:type VI protein secretion system component Hcp
MFRKQIATILCALAMSVVSTAHADSVALTMKTESIGAIPSTAAGRNAVIDCIALNGLDFSIDAERGANPTVGDIQCVKKIDRSSPLIMQALLNRERITEGKIRLSRPNPIGDGSVVIYAELAFRGTFTQLQQSLANTAQPAQEVVGIHIDWAQLTIKDGNVSAVYDGSRDF